MTIEEARKRTVEICNSLDAVKDLNLSSAAMIRAVKNMLTSAPQDAKFALIVAERAATTQDLFNTEWITEDSKSWKTMTNDPTSMLYRP